MPKFLLNKSMKNLSSWLIAISAILLLFSAETVRSQNRCSYVVPGEAQNIILPPGRLVFTGDGTEEVYDLPGTLSRSKATAALSDSAGNLLFISNGISIMNNNLNVIQNGGNIHGNVGSVQPAVFLPLPGSETRFYVFTTDVANNVPIPEEEDKGLNYHVIDIEGGARVVSKNNNLLESSTEKITATQHADGEDFWIVAHGWENDNFYVYRLTSDGLVTDNPEPQSYGIDHDFAQDEENESQNSTGVMKFSPDGTKLAVAILGDGIVELFDFDKETGTISSGITLDDPLLEGAFGLEFSPAGNYLYITATGTQESDSDNLLLQADITLPDEAAILNSVVTLNPDSDFEQDVEGLQLTTNRRILVSRAGKRQLGMIKNPDRPGALCNYDEEIVNLEANLTTQGLTNFASHYLDIPPFTWDTKCHGDETWFQITNEMNIDDAIWDFDDPEGESDLSDPLNPYHVFSEPGGYEVTLTLEADGQTFDYTQTVTIHPLPEPDLGQNRYVFPGSSLVLSPGEFYSYDWEDPFSDEQEVRITETGEYIVTVEDENCCYQSDTAQVVFVPLEVPNAIHLQSNIAENRVFEVSGEIEGMSDFQMQIFNRWGQMLFNTTDRNEGWDGTYQDEPVQRGTYTYIIRFVITDEEQNERNISRTGTVTVIP